MNKGLVRNIFMLLSILFLSGCAVGQKIKYHDTELELKASGNTRVAVAALDSRTYIKDGAKNRTYVGNLRGGFGNPFNLSTDSGKPLADDMAAIICASLKKKGFGCTPISVEPNEPQAQIKNKLQATNASILILLSINEWLSSTYQNTGLTYDLLLTLMDKQGAMLVEKKLQGKEHLGGSFWSPPAHAKEAVPEAYKKILESLLNDPTVIKILE